MQKEIYRFVIEKRSLIVIVQKSVTFILKQFSLLQLILSTIEIN